MQPSQTNDQCFTTQGGLSVTVNTGSWDAKSQNSAPNSCRFPQMRVAQLQWEKMLPVRGSNVQAGNGEGPYARGEHERLRCKGMIQ